ncbi:RNA-directed DNA polymerase [Ahniella affigens]|uniref:RNA-directed DNA polymerase n=1 Tax=Ahniella affigens TaxID=2021234 RepID=A0A2P1PNR5_9GAMM|nr:RNA-directed DNA polymerase [Ahniella affigens]
MRILNTIESWEAYFEDVCLREDIAAAHLKIISAQLKSGVPVIFDVEHLSLLLGVSSTYLASAVSVPRYHYRDFAIPKKRGGVRTISAPRAALKGVQRWILDNILNCFLPHKCAFGFRAKKSILNHARTHCTAGRILKLDVAEFFPSIKLDRVIGLFKSFGYTPGVAFTLASLCCLDRQLPQGAPTSPAISNLVCRRLDNRLHAFASKNRFRYSRYADDIALSGRDLNSSVIQIIRGILAEEGFALRDDKTRIYGVHSKRILTGLSASLDGVKLPREDRRQLRSVCHQIRKFGFLSYLANNKIRDPMFLARLIGRFSFWCYIEPENAFASEALAHLRGVERQFLAARS